MIHAAVTQMAQMLKNLSAILDKSVQHAKEREFDVGNLLQARLSPDMFHVIRQIQSAADTAKFAAARTSGRKAPAYDDTETTVDELRARLHKTVEFLESFGKGDFDGWQERHIVLPFLADHYILGADYLMQFALPNFYFHATTAYAILRHNGVTIGKRDYLGHLSMKPNA